MDQSKDYQLLIRNITFNFYFNPPDNNKRVFSGGIKDCVETANSLNQIYYKFYYNQVISMHLLYLFQEHP